MNIKIEVILILFVFGILGTILLAGVLKPTDDKKKTSMTIYMDSEKNRLVVNEPSGEFAAKEIEKIFFNKKDYTRFAEKLMSSQPLCFASSRILIFGKAKIVLKNEQWQCDAGTLFIPGEKEILIIDASGISLDEDLQMLNIKNAKVKQISLDKNLEVEKEQQGIIMDLSKN